MRLGALAVAAAAALLAGYWVFLVPIFQAPDEPPHLDYALGIYAAGKLINVRDRPLAPAAFDLVVHPYAVYLEQQTDFSAVLKDHAPIAPDYGTCTYYHQLDRNAPVSAALTVPSANPSLITQYPFGYYALLAAWLRLVAGFTGSLVALFFAGRLLSVALFFTSLMLTFGIAGQLGIRGWRALGLVALVGFFPMTTFVSAYIQPDNLTFTLVALATYLALRQRRSANHLGLLAALGMALGALLVTKWHIYLCLAPWLVATVVLAWRRRSIRSVPQLAAALGLPSLVLGAIQLWVIWGATVRSYSPTGYGRPIFGPFVTALHGGPLPLIVYIGRELGASFTNFFVNGQVTSSFWGRFGYDDTPIQFGPPRLDLLVQLLRAALVIVVLILFLVSRWRIGVRLLAVARRGRGAATTRLFMSDPLLNAYLTFTAFMIVLYVASDNFFAAQGRNWLPFLLPLFLVPLRYAPRAARVRGARRLVSRGLAVVLAAYCMGGSFFAVQSVRDRYYGTAVAARPVVPLTCTPLLPAVALVAGRR